MFHAAGCDSLRPAIRHVLSGDHAHMDTSNRRKYDSGLNKSIIIRELDLPLLQCKCTDYSSSYQYNNVVFIFDMLILAKLCAVPWFPVLGTFEVESGSWSIVLW